MNTVKLGEYGSFRNGLNFSKEESKGKGCKILGVGDFENKTFIPVDSLDEINTDLVTEDDIIQNGDIIFVRSNGNKSLVGRMLLAKGIEERICYSGFCIRFRPYNSNNSLNLFYALKSPYCKKQYTPSQQTNITNLSQDKLSEVLIPDFLITSSQNKAVNLLSNLDEMIDLNKRLCTELEAMAKTLYDYWFVQFDFPDENGKPYHTSGGTMEWCQELGREVPKGWKVKRVSELTKVITGKEDANFSTEDGEYKFFTCGQDTLHCNTPAFTGKAVLIAGNGDFNVKHYTGSFNAYQRTYVLIPNEEKYYAAMFIAAKDTIQSFRQGSNGSIVKFITKVDVEKITLLTPANDYLLFQLNRIVEQIELFEKENDELIKLRDWLLPMLMNGQVKVFR